MMRKVATHRSLEAIKHIPLIPLNRIYASTTSESDFQLSPDGSKYLWKGIDKFRPCLFWAYIKTKTKTKTKTKIRRNIRHPFHVEWCHDSNHIVYSEICNGSAGTNIHIYNCEVMKSRNITPLEGSTSYVVKLPKYQPEKIFLVSNYKSHNSLRLYAYDIFSGIYSEVEFNSDDVKKILVDEYGEICISIRSISADEDVLIHHSEDGPNKILKYDNRDIFVPLSLSTDSMSLYAISNVGRDKSEIVEICLLERKSATMYASDIVDILDGWVDCHGVFLANTHEGYPKAYGDNALLSIIKSADIEHHSIIVKSLTSDRTEVTLSVTENGGEKIYHADLKNSDEIKCIADNTIDGMGYRSCATIPFTFEARDGMLLHGYITRPSVAGEGFPLIVLVHGGPWIRDKWGFDSQVQILCNRGYAVLQVNYRGSAGYGRVYSERGIGEFGNAIQEDIVDCLLAAKEHIKYDANNVGIMGASFGGFAALYNLIFHPSYFKCGICISGVSDWNNLLDSNLPAWQPFREILERFIGPANESPSRESRDEYSPLHNAEKIKSPLLVIHTSEDDVVPISQSDMLINKFDAAGKKNYRYRKITSEKHVITKWKSNIQIQREIEDFLHENLGGRSGGIDTTQLVSWAF